MFNVSKKMRVVLLAAVMILAMGLCLQGCSDSSEAKQASNKSQETRPNSLKVRIEATAMDAAKGDVEFDTPCMAELSDGCVHMFGLEALRKLRSSLGILTAENEDKLFRYYSQRYFHHYNYFKKHGVD